MFLWKSLTFWTIQRTLAIWSQVPLPFLNPAWTSGISWFTYYWNPAWRILSIALLVCDTERWAPQVVGAQYATEEEWSNNSRNDEETEPEQKQHPVVDVTGDRGKVWCCKEQYCIGTWNVRSMNQSKLEVVKQELARVNVNIFRNQWFRMDWNG